MREFLELIHKRPLRVVGTYTGPVSGMTCSRHTRGVRAQPVFAEDVPGPSRVWCAKCAKLEGRKAGHEYLVDKAGTGAQVFDLTFAAHNSGNDLIAFRGSYDECQSWVG